MRQLPASKDVNTEAEEATALKAVRRRQQMMIQQAKKQAVMNYTARELELGLYLFVVTFCKSSMNPISNSNPVHSHSYT
jgi:hypothetical protein